MRAWRTIAIAAVTALIAGTGTLWAARTNYLGTVFIADTTTPTNQLTVNSDGSVNTSGVSGTIISTGQVRLVIQGTLSTQSGTYTTNNAEGALVTLPNFGRAGASGKIEWVNLIDNNGNKVQSDAFFFNQNPTGSTCTDKTAASFVKADQSKMIGVVHLGDFSQLGNGTPQLLQSLAVDMPFRLPAAGTSAWVCFVTRGTPVFVSTSDLIYQVSVVQDLD